MEREYPERPVIGVGGVIFDDSKVLLVRRNQEPGKGEWSLPGGAVELGETVIDALKREVWEETSIRIEVGGLIRVLDRIVYDRHRWIQYHYVIADYWARKVSGLPRPASDISDLCFVPLNEVDAMEIRREVKETILMGLVMRDHEGRENPKPQDKDSSPSVF